MGDQAVRWMRAATALFLGALGGATFAWLNAPLPWMLGPIFTIAACNLANPAAIMGPDTMVDHGPTAGA